MFLEFLNIKIQTKTKKVKTGQISESLSKIIPSRNNSKTNKLKTTQKPSANCSKIFKYLC
ncbi:TPA: hypothetical protein DEG21_01630 [Patescibacteria group bacterium]|nr:hypothetical protein [Candidatus Gracilibacteria bacterium]HBY74589.1 hypothetical protein [Candidatus Gracilibacteria bacterium]